VDDTAFVSSVEVTPPVATNGGAAATFTILAPPITLRRNADLTSLDPTVPPKGAAAWGTVMDLVGSCDPAAPRLGPEDDQAAPGFPPSYCFAGDGATGSGLLLFYEVAGDCGARLTVARSDCDGDTVTDDVEVSYP
jgi:hypothetical protein